MQDNQQPSPMRQCKHCGETKPITAFPQTKSEGNGRMYRRHECHSCCYRRQAEWREKNRERLRAQGTERVREWREGLSPERFAEYRRSASEKASARLAKIRAAVYEAYGGYACACCGETQRMFLSIDHINNDGYKMRKEGIHGSGARLHNWLWSQHKATGQWPSGFQILCMNCQHGKARNGGVCPHQEGSTAIP